MSKRRHKRNQHNQSRLTHAQLCALIPGGSVNRHRAARDKIEVEVRAASDGGRALVTGQVVSTVVRNLREAGFITTAEEQATRTFCADFELAYCGSTNALASIQVDQAGDGTHALERKVHHGMRFRAACTHLGNEMTRVALAAFLEIADIQIESSYTGIGREMLPTASKQQQREGGRAVLVMVIREIANFYEFKNKNRNPIHI